MPERPHVHLRSVDPILSVRDLSGALDYYQRTLGFELGWVWGDPPEMASVCRDAVSIQLAQVPEQLFRASRIYIHVTDIDVLYRTIDAAGANFNHALGDQVYGMRDFQVLDPDGNQIGFGEPIGPG